MVDRAPDLVLIDHDRVHHAILGELAAELKARDFEVARGAAVGALTSPACREVRFFVTTARGKVDEAVLAGMPNLHTVVVPTTGVESLDLNAARAHGVAIANGATPENHVSMAEATLLLILASLYRLPEAAAGHPL